MANKQVPESVVVAMIRRANRARERANHETAKANAAEARLVKVLKTLPLGISGLIDHHIINTENREISELADRGND